MNQDLSTVLTKSIRTTVSVFVLSTSIFVVDKPNIAHALDYSLTDTQSGCYNANAQKSDASDSSSSSNGKSDANQGTYNMENIRKIYDIMHDDYGLSAKMIAGILGNWQQESNIKPDIENEIGAFGLGQWLNGRRTGLQEFAKKHGKKESDLEIQVRYAMEGEEDSNTLASIIKDKNKSIDEYVTDFMTKWERMGAHEAMADTRIKYAKDIYDLMKDEGMDGSADDSKMAKVGFGSKGSASSGTSGASSSSTSDEMSVASFCGQGETDTTGSLGWGDDGTGTHKYSGYSVWKPDELPEDLKKYAIDPKSVGLKWKSPSGWTNPGGQCVHFTSSLLYALWEKDGKRNEKAAGSSGGKGGDGSYFGYNMADAYADVYGGKVTMKPSKGAISGAPANTPPEANSFAGHTVIVSHVFENGDTLVVEQNWSNSGDAIGQPETWNYRISHKDEYTKAKVRFFSPQSVGYKASDKVRMMK